MSEPAAQAFARPEGPASIAVVGTACRLPQADTPEAFWELLRDGRDAVTGLPEDRPDLHAPGEARQKARRGAFLDHVDLFDPAFFGIGPREAAAMDPQQRLVLELAWEALERTGIVPASLAGTRTGVFVGAMADDYARLTQQLGPAAVGQHTATGLHRGIIANRVSYLLGLTGPSMSVDTGQSSSLTAVHLACESLLRGEADLALAAWREPQPHRRRLRDHRELRRPVARRPLPHLRRPRQRLRTRRGRRARAAQAARRRPRRRRPRARRHPRQRRQQRRHHGHPHHPGRPGPDRPAAAGLRPRRLSSQATSSTSNCTAPARGSATPSRRRPSARPWAQDAATGTGCASAPPRPTSATWKARPASPA